MIFQFAVSNLKLKQMIYGLKQMIYTLDFFPLIRKIFALDLCNGTTN